MNYLVYITEINNRGIITMTDREYRVLADFLHHKSKMILAGNSKKEAAEKFANMISFLADDKIVNSPEPYLSSTLEWTLDLENADLKIGVEKCNI